jgi:hypothetical protein
MFLTIEQTHDPLDVTPILIFGHGTTFEETWCSLYWFKILDYATNIDGFISFGCTYIFDQDCWAPLCHLRLIRYWPIALHFESHVGLQPLPWWRQIVMIFLLKARGCRCGRFQEVRNVRTASLPRAFCCIKLQIRFRWSCATHPQFG